VRGALNPVARGACAAALLFAAGCSDSAEPPENGGDVCDPQQQGELVEGAVSIGTNDGGFAPYVEGQTAELVLGLQGGYMLQPSFRIDGARLGSDGHCARLDVLPSVDSQAAPPLGLTIPNHATGTEWLVEGLPMFLSSALGELEGKTCTITAYVQDDGRHTTSVVNVVLVDEHRGP
jgi:hypothetical protein